MMKTSWRQINIKLENKAALDLGAIHNSDVILSSKTKQKCEHDYVYILFMNPDNEIWTDIFLDPEIVEMEKFMNPEIA